MISLRVKRINKILSFLLLFAMIITLFPAGAFAETDTGMDMGSKEITSFEPTTINAGPAGSAAYADAAAVIEHLNANYASVTAQVYGGGTVTVPATSWTDTDAYDPSTPGSYTFTAALGEILAGYTNPASLTATAEALVAESARTGEGTGTGEAGGTALQDTMAALTAEGGSLADGLYDIPTSFHTTPGYPSGSVNTMLASAELEVTGGAIKVILNVVEGQTVSGIDYIRKLQFESVYESGTYEDATIEATDVSGKPSKISFVLSEEQEYTRVKLERGVGYTYTYDTYLYLNFAGATIQEPPAAVDRTALAAKLDEARAIEQGSYTQESYDALQQAITTAEAVLSDENATQGEVDEAALLLQNAMDALEEEQADIEITGFDPITVNAGAVGATVYADAAAVIAALSAQYPSVTAQVYGGTVTVPVTSWTDTDTYDPAVAGSYTFTAALGEITASYVLGEGVTATAEVLVAEGGLAPSVYSVPLTFYSGLRYAKYENNVIFNAATHRFQFNHRALVTANPDGTYQVKLRVESYSLMDFIQIVDPALVSQVKSLFNPLYNLLPGTFNCPETYRQTLLGLGLISADTNGYYLQGDSVKLDAADPALDTGYVTFTVPNLDDDVLLKAYSYLFGQNRAISYIMRFSPEQAVPLPESLVYPAGNRTMGFAWTNYVEGDSSNAERDVDGSCLQFLDGLFEEAVDVAVDENGKMAATFTLKGNRPDPVVSIEVARSRGDYESYPDAVKSYVLNEFICTTYDQVEVTDGKITLEFDDMAFGRSMRISTESTHGSRYYFGCLRLEPATGGGDEELVLESSGVRLIASTNSIPANSVFTAEVGKHVPQYLEESAFNNMKSFSKDGESYLVYDTSLTSGGGAVQPSYPVILEMPIPNGFDIHTLTIIQLKGTSWSGVNASQPTAGDFCTLDEENRLFWVETSDPAEITTTYMLVDRGTGLDVSALEEGLYRAKVSTAHNFQPQNPSMSNGLFVDAPGFLDVKQDGSWQLYLDLQPVNMSGLRAYISGMNYFAGETKTPVTTLAYHADGDNLQVDAIAAEYRLHYSKRVVLSTPSRSDAGSDGSYYEVTFIIPIMDGLSGGTPGSGKAEATARLRITNVEEITDGVNPLTGYDRTVLKAKMNQACWLLEILDDGSVKTTLQNAVAAAQTTYDINPDSGTVLAATQTLAAAIEAAESGTPVRLEAPTINSAYDEQNNSYTVTITSQETGTIKYRLSGSESGAGEWQDYTAPFTVDSANEQISQGLLYVSAYVASTETGVEDSETSQTLLDFREGEEPGPIVDGEYTVPVRLWHASSDQASMGDAALEKTAKLTVANGQGTLQLTFKPLTFMQMTGYLSQLDLLGSIVFNENNYPVSYDLIPATVLSTYDVVDDFNKPDSTDPKCRNKPYPKDLTIPIVLNQQYTWAHVYVPVMGSLGFGDQVARVKLDWSGLTPAEPEGIGIAAFDPITVEAGTAGSATYADAATVIAYLNTTYDSVTAQVYGGGTVTVPVTSWTAPDGEGAYDPNTPGSYTFTATLGEIPDGYVLGEGVTATAEVVLAEAPPETLADGVYSIDVQGWHVTDDAPSMLASMLDQDARLEVSGGEITATIRFIKTTLFGTAVNGQSVLEVWPEPAATPTAGTGITGAYNSSDESKTFNFALSTLEMPRLALNVGPPMNSIQTVRLKFDMESLTPVSEVVDITGFEPIADLDGGTVAAPVYADAEAVRAALPATVTIAGTGDTVSVSSWEDTDSYNPATAGSYIFTATLGEIPAGYANPDNLTATAEVVVAPDPDDEPVVFADVNLKNAVCGALKKPSDYIATVRDMKRLTSLDASGWGIADLTGLWTAVNLEILDLSDNPLTKNLTSGIQYDNVLLGIENLVKLKELDLSNCDLGISNYNPQYAYPPASIMTRGVCELPNLEKLDLSNNKMKGYFYINKTLPNLKELDLSGNYLFSPQIAAAQFPAIASVDLSNNYLYVDESEVFYGYAIETGLEKFTLDNMRNLADLFAIRLTNAGTTKNYIIESGAYTVDAGTLLGGNLSLACLVYSSDNTVKVTVNGEKYTAVNFTNSSWVFIPLSNLETGKDHSIEIEVMHLGGDTRTYTLTFRTTALPFGGEDQAGIVDANLQYAVCSKLGKDPSAYVVTKEDMASLTGSLSVNNVTDVEGIQYATGINSLRLFSGTYTVLPDLSGLAKLTSLTIDSPNLTAIPSLSGLTALKTLTINSGGSGLTIPEGIENCTALTAFTVSNCDGFDFTGLEAAPALSNFKIDQCQNFILPATLKDLNTLTILQITNCGLTQVPGIIGEMTQFQTLNLTGNRLSDFPDLSGLTALTSLNLSNNAFVDIPANVVKLTGLQTLVMERNSMSAMTADLSPLEQLQSLYLSNCGLREFPAGIFELSALKTLDLSWNSLRCVEGSLANLQNLTYLDLENNHFDEFPAGIKDLAALATLHIRYNHYTDLPADLADYLPNLRTFWYGGYIRYGASTSEPDPESNAAAVVASLKSRSPVVTVLFSQSPRFSSLRKLEWDFGEITQIHDSSTEIREYTLTVPQGTTGLTFTLTAMLNDTAITVNGNPVANGGSIEVPVSSGLNQVEIVCDNPYAVSTSNTKTTYKLTILVGSSVGGDFPVEGRRYSIDMRLWHRSLGQYSMADAYFKHSAEMTYGQGRFDVYVTVLKDSWITEMSYQNADGEYVRAERVFRDAAANTAVYRLYVEEDALDEDLYISPYVVPMGSSPVCRIVFDIASIIDITSGGEPDPIPDGAYTLPVRLWNAVSDQASMGNNALEQTARIEVEEGAGTLYMQFKPLTIEAFQMTGYLANLKLAINVQFNDLGGIAGADLTDAAVVSSYDGVWDTYNHPETGTDPNVKGKTYPKVVSIPVELEAEYTYVQVYVPVMEAISTGGGAQYARVKLDWSGLTAVGQPNPDTEPAQEISDEDGDGTIELTQDALSGLTGTDNVGLTAGGASINIPAQYLNDIFAGSPGATLKFEAKETPADTQDAVFQLLGDNDELAASFDLNLQMGGQAITDLGGRVKITVSLTDAQVEALASADTKKLCYYNPATGELTDMNATFDLAAKTMTFYTDHLSTYAIVATKSGGSPGGSGGNSHGIANGTYSIKVDAIQEYTNSASMADQFFTEPAELSVSGETITVTVTMYGTSSSPELATGIKMSYLNSLQYKNTSGTWVNAIDSRNEAQDSLKVKMTVSSLNDIYMRVQTDFMGPDYKTFRLVFDRSTLQQGGVVSGGGATTTYTIKATAGQGGAIDPSGNVSVKKGADQTFTITPAAGYQIKDVEVDGKTVGAVSTYTFEDVAKDAAISARFEKTEELPPPVPVPAAASKFTDITGHWAEQAITFVVSRGMFVGTSETQFSPDALITRGMFVTALGRISQIDPAAQAIPPFADVDPDAYYAPYIAWASAHDIARGVGDGRFEPDREITREELAVIFVRYARIAGIELTDAPAAEEPAPEGALKDGRYTIEAAALMENKDEHSMADQFLTEPAVLTVAGGRITAAMTWHGTEYITMDMLEELKILKSPGELVDVKRTFNQEQNTLAITFEVEDLDQPTIIQVYVPRGMGEIRPKFRLVLDDATLKEQAPAPAQPVPTFADAAEISDWAIESVQTMTAAGLIRGRDDNTFDPRGLTTRAEAATILARSAGFEG
jgi:heme-binding NEAT domain protein/Leucine-rich repeat (LRR) protein